MPNAIFADHVTNTAFFLSISQKQIKYLDHYYHYPYGCGFAHYARDNIVGGRSDPDNWIASLRSLERKGLVVRVIDDVERNAGHYELTIAGTLTCELLIEAGLIEAKQVKSKVA